MTYSEEDIVAINKQHEINKKNEEDTREELFKAVKKAKNLEEVRNAFNGTSTTFNSDELNEKISLEERVEDLKRDIERLENTKGQLTEHINSLYCKNLDYMRINKETYEKYHRIFDFDCNFQAFWKSIEEGKTHY